ncbi:MAG: helix-turn-helix domain-containing protein [Candidatus Eremiobacteraeota bacterium]|nr:helix-turn-helix domain-containing protein [Candidatus Eremiobacteraeota bacterium]
MGEVDTHQSARPTNRIWLGEFLRSRRARLSPSELGFPLVKRRRTHGLLREEVAQLAGVSVAYYTWIEQGRELNVSTDVLNAIARALQLSEAERIHLFTLVGIEVAEEPAEYEEIHPAIAHYFSDPGSRACALLLDGWFTTLRASPLAEATFTLRPGADLRSNVLYMLFTEERRRRFPAWESEAHMILGMFRQALAKHPGSIQGLRLLDALHEFSDFERIWAAYDVRLPNAPGEFFLNKPFEYDQPEVGLMHLHRVGLQAPGDKLVILCSPADAATAEKLAALRVEAR